MFPADGTITDEATFRNAAGTLYDPTTVVLTVRQPSGTNITPATTKISTGIYRANFILYRGITRWVWDGITGSVHDRIDGWACAAEGITAA